MRVLRAKLLRSEAINKITFTARELDVAACLICGRRTKTIAAMLSITPRTVDVHVRNIALKIGGNYRETIINFFEASRSLDMLRNRYNLLLEDCCFVAIMDKIRAAHIFTNRTVQIIYHNEPKKDINRIAEVVKKYIACSGITLSVKNRTDVINIIVNSKQTKQLKKDLPKIRKNINLLIVFINIAKESVCIDDNFKKIFLYDEQPMYLSLLQLMYNIVPAPEILALEKSFATQADLLYKAVLETPSMVNKEPTVSIVVPKIRNNYIRAIIVVICLLGVGLFVVNRKGFIAENIVEVDFLLPTKDDFLCRNFILENIDVKFSKNQKAIGNIVIIGVYGSGKTTLAREYAISRKNNIFREINAENEMEIIRSFEKLVAALSTSTAEKKDLECLYFIKNIDLLKNIVQYLPRNAHIWDKVKVIILTKNKNILLSKYIDKCNIIYIPELSAEERESLFFKIYNVPEKN